RLECLGQVRKLRVEILLALGLLLELVDRGEIDRPEPLDLSLDRLEGLRPRRGRRVLRKSRDDLLEIEPGFPKLLGNGLEPRLGLARGAADAVPRVARGGGGPLDLVSLLLDFAQLSIQRLDRPSCFREPALDLRPLVAQLREQAFVRGKRLDGVFELISELVATLRQMLLLSQHARERGARRFLRVTSRLDLDRELLSELALTLRPRSGLRQ